MLHATMVPLKAYVRLPCILATALLFCGACGNDGAAAQDAAFVCDFPLTFQTGDDGHQSPLASAPGEARAGRVSAEDLPGLGDGLAVYDAGDFVIANDHFALLIEDAGDSDLYDPWGGRPVGLAFIENGNMVTPSNFGEFYVMTEGQTIVTETVSVLNDGSNGEAAVIRAEGRLAALPFTHPIISGIYRGRYEDMRGAIDYVLEPGADTVDIVVTYHSPRRFEAEVPSALHGFMYTKRMRRFTRGQGFEPEADVLELGFIDDEGPSFSYSTPGAALESGISVSGFALNLGDGFTIAACGETRRTHARLTIGGPGVDGLVQALAEGAGEPLRTISGVVSNADASPAAGVRVHALLESGDYLTRATTAQDGSFSLHAPGDAAVSLEAFRVGDDLARLSLPADLSVANLQLLPTGFIEVSTVDQDSGEALPVRIQVLPTGQDLPGVPNHYGEEPHAAGRLHVAYAMAGTARFRAPVGEWEVVVSRGYEYELFSEIVTVTANETSSVAASLEHVVETDGQLCADYHIHTMRSADSGDDVLLKVQSAVADGLELPVRSEHEFAADFQDEISALGVEEWAYGVPSVELTTMEFAGHFGVVPVLPDGSKPNADAPRWQRYATQEDPEQELETLQPPEIFSQVRARPEAPSIIINHPRGGANYFDYVGFDPVTGLFDFPEYWDEDFSLIEVFNDSSWQENLDGTVADWLSLLGTGRRVFAVGSSDSHGISGSPVGYPRTCLALGTDSTTALTHEMVRDTTAAGHSMVSGGIYVDASVNGVGPGDEAFGLDSTATLHLRVQAASWIDVDSLDIVVDGDLFTLDILPDDAAPGNPTIRFDGDIAIDVSTDPGAYVLVAAYGDAALEPVHPGRIPFGVSNPIFLSR